MVSRMLQEADRPNGRSTGHVHRIMDRRFTCIVDPSASVTNWHLHEAFGGPATPLPFATVTPKNRKEGSLEVIFTVDKFLDDSSLTPRQELLVRKVTVSEDCTTAQLFSEIESQLADDLSPHLVQVITSG